MDIRCLSRYRCATSPVCVAIFSSDGLPRPFARLAHPPRPGTGARRLLWPVPLASPCIAAMTISGSIWGLRPARGQRTHLRERSLVAGVRSQSRNHVSHQSSSRLAPDRRQPGQLYPARAPACSVPNRHRGREPPGSSGRNPRRIDRSRVRPRDASPSWSGVPWRPSLAARRRVHWCRSTASSAYWNSSLVAHSFGMSSPRR